LYSGKREWEKIQHDGQQGSQGKSERKKKDEDRRFNTKGTKDLNGKAKGRRKMKTEVLTRRAPRISTEKQKEEER
jgi:hypothetical protein